MRVCWDVDGIELRRLEMRGVLMGWLLWPTSRFALSASPDDGGKSTFGARILLNVQSLFKVLALYSYDIYPRPIKEIVSYGLFLLALLIRHVSGMYGHLNISTGSIPF